MVFTKIVTRKCLYVNKFIVLSESFSVFSSLSTNKTDDHDITVDLVESVGKHQ